MRILFMGTPAYADTILKKLLEEPGMEVAAVFTQPDRPVGRKKVLTPPPVKTTAEAAGVPVHQPDHLKDRQCHETIATYRPDFIVVAAYGQLLPKEILQLAPCINLHASLLPKYRGASPIQEALLHGDEKTGMTAMAMEEGLDSGPVLAYSVREIFPTYRKNELFTLLAEDAAQLTVAVLKRYDRLRPLPQCDADASYCRKIRRNDGLIDFSMDASTIYNRFRAFEGWPGIFLASGLKLLEIVPTAGQGEAGRILAIEEESVTVACGQGALIVAKVQPPSKKAMDGASYVRGKRLGVGDLFV